MCYYADFHRSNFPVDVNGQLWVIDFEHAGVLPSSFMSYALRAHPRGLSHTLRKEIPVPVSNNLVAMGNASYIFKCVHNDFRELRYPRYFPQYPRYSKDPYRRYLPRKNSRPPTWPVA